jgi:hypothetical protein
VSHVALRVGDGGDKGKTHSISKRADEIQRCALKSICARLKTHRSVDQSEVLMQRVEQYRFFSKTDQATSLTPRCTAMYLLNNLEGETRKHGPFQKPVSRAANGRIGDVRDGNRACGHRWIGQCSIRATHRERKDAARN